MQITLRAARVMCGYTVGEVAESCGVSVEEYEGYERDTRGVPMSTACKLADIYGASWNWLFIGLELDAIRINRVAACTQLCTQAMQ